MLEKFIRAASSVARFYCGRKGAAFARMMISFCALVLMGGVSIVSCSAPPVYRAVTGWANRVEASIDNVNKEVEAIKNDRRVFQAGEIERNASAAARELQQENNINELQKSVADHERRIYRLEGIK